MRRLLLSVAVSGLILSQTGCFINMYASNPNRRMKELLNVSEGLRQMQDDWERIWFVDRPSPLTYDRVSGAVE